MSIEEVKPAGSNPTHEPIVDDWPPKGRSSIDRIIDIYKAEVDHEKLRENLKLTVEQRLEKHRLLMEFVEELRRSKPGGDTQEESAS
jgi:hypothetical protein